MEHGCLLFRFHQNTAALAEIGPMTLGSALEHPAHWATMAKCKEKYTAKRKCTVGAINLNKPSETEKEAFMKVHAEQASNVLPKCIKVHDNLP